MGLIKKSLKYVIATVLFVAIIVGLIFVMNYLEENPIFYKHQKENQYESNKKQISVNKVEYTLTEGGYAVTNVGDDVTELVIKEEFFGIPVVEIKAIGKPLYLHSIVIPKYIKRITANEFRGKVCLLEVYNLSELPIEAGSESYGCVGLYAKDIYNSLDCESKITRDNAGYYKYIDGEDVILLGYDGKETDLILPNDITSVRGYNFPDKASVTITSAIESEFDYNSLVDAEDFDEAFEATFDAFSTDGIIISYVANKFNNDSSTIFYVENIETVKTYYYLVFAELLNEEEPFAYVLNDLVIPDEILENTIGGVHYKAKKGDVVEHNGKEYCLYIVEYQE